MSARPDDQRTPPPFHLRGNYAPIAQEMTTTSLPVSGVIPEDINGLYVRNGPNPASGVSSHWFTGDGMLHGVRLEGGRAVWYRNRYVKTRSLAGDGRFLGEDGSVDRTVSVANTHVIRHHGVMLALVENTLPTCVTPLLETTGPYDFGGQLTSNMTAHPKECPVSGELHFFGYHFAPPFLTYHRLTADGVLEFSREIDVAGPTMVHDFAITRDHVVFLDLPVVFDWDKAAAGAGMPYRWSDDYGARVGVLRRNDESAPVRWFDVQPCYVFHVMNAFDTPQGVSIDVARYDSMWREQDNHFTSAYLTRWAINFQDARVNEQTINGHALEFPRINDSHQGLDYRYGYAPLTGDGGDDGLQSRAIGKVDLVTGECRPYAFEDEVNPGEFVFAPRAGATREDSGYLMGFGYHPSSNASALYIFDAEQAGSSPLARIDLPQRVPFGFHGSWLADSNP